MPLAFGSWPSLCTVINNRESVYYSMRLLEADPAAMELVKAIFKKVLPPCPQAARPGAKPAWLCPASPLS